MNSNFWKKLGSGVAEFFIFMHKMGLILIADGIKDVQNDSVALGILGIILGILMIILIITLDALVLYGIYYAYKRISIKMRTKNIEHHKVVGRVTGKDYKSSYISTTLVGKNLLPVYHPEAYNVYVEYKEITGEFNSENLYRKYKKGDPIKLVLVLKIDKHDKLIEATLELPE